MSKSSSSSKATVPAILGLLVALVLVLGFSLGWGPREASEGASQQEPPVAGDYWRCVACTKAPGKAWAACQQVTGIGDELGAKNRAKEKACDSVGVPVETCQLEKMSCRKLQESEIQRIKSSVRLEEVPE